MRKRETFLLDYSLGLLFFSLDLMPGTQIRLMSQIGGSSNRLGKLCFWLAVTVDLFLSAHKNTWQPAYLHLQVSPNKFCFVSLSGDKIQARFWTGDQKSSIPVDLNFHPMYLVETLRLGTKAISHGVPWKTKVNVK